MAEPDASLQRISRSPLYEQVAERLREFIDTQQLKPGDRLMSERELAERLGVSRTSVRQALTALRVVGLIEIRHGEGIYLLRSPRDLIPTLAANLAESEVDHPMIWEVREGIEVQATRLAARRRTESDLDEMRAAIDEMALDIDAGGDGVDGDRRFHHAVAIAAHNPLLEQLIGQLADMVDRTSAASLTLSGRPPISLEAHRAILATIETRDEPAAAETMRDHIVVSGTSVYASSASNAE